MKISKTSLARLSFFVTVAVMVIFSVQTAIINLISSEKTVTALSITSITSNFGPTEGGELVTITGDFDIPKGATQITSGQNHSLAIAGNGDIFAWGSNIAGRLGNGTNIDSNVPVAVDMSGVLAGRTITQVEAGSNHSLALDSEGRVFAWGNNSSGQLGNGVGTGSSNVPVAVDMSGVLAGRTITQIAAGASYSLALDDEGMVFSWGSGTSGVLGNGASTASNVPVAVDTSGVLAGRTIAQISANNNLSLALDDEGSVFAWGWNAGGGQLGNGSTNTSSNIPVAVDTSGVLAGRTIVQVAAGVLFALALDDQGDIFAWGAGSGGTLGNGTTTNSNLPVAVDMSGVLAGRNIAQIAAGSSRSFALDIDGNVFAWGVFIGDGSYTSSSVPAAICASGALVNQTITQIASSADMYTIALGNNGSIFAWGANWNGQFGNGTNIGSNVPVFSNHLGFLYNPIESITLGGLPCTNITVTSPNTVTCITPAHPAGVVDVTVYTLHGSVTLHQSYTFVDVPDVPNTGHERV